MMLLVFLKASVLLSVTLAGTRALRRAPAASRHQLWTLAFAALLGLPLLAAALPSLDVPLPGTWRALPATIAVAQEPAMTVTPQIPGAASAHERASFAPVADPASVSAIQTRPSVPSLAAILRAIWIAGAATATCTLLLSFARVRRLSCHSRPVDDPGWQQAARQMGERFGLRRSVRVVVSEDVRTPMAGGTWQPTVFLPPSAARWDDDRRDIVLAHEVAHLASRDPLRLVTARLALACYWFHPLAWLAAREAAIAREQACDEAVLALGVRPSVYARTLLELADAMAPAPRLAAALSMIEPSLLEKRLIVILSTSDRPAPARRPFTLALSAILITLSVAAARPAARSLTVTPPELPAATPSPAAPAPVRAPEAVPQQTPRDSACAADVLGNFSGYTNTDRSGRIVDRVGRGVGGRIILRHFGDLVVCMLSDDVTGPDRPSEWPGRAARVVLETERSGSTQRLEIVRQAGGVKETWQVNGVERPVDAAARTWRTALLAVMDREWEISSLRGEVSTLRGEISTLRGQESTLRGEISTLRGDVSTMRGRQSTIRGEESTLRGRISEIQGQVSTLRGRISSEQGEISSLVSSRYGATDADRARMAAQIHEHEAAIDRLERELHDFNAAAKIDEVERQIRALDADGKVAAIETQVRNFDESAKTAAIERQIASLLVDAKTADIERQIRALNADDRTSRLEDQLDEDLRRLEQALKAIR